MATYNFGIDKSFTAAINLSGSQYQFVKAGSVAGEVTLNGTDGGSCLGVLQNDPLAGDEAVVRVFGFSKVKANTESGASPLNYASFIKSGSDGRARGYVTPTAGSAFVQGVFMDAAYTTGSGTVVEVFLTFPYRYGSV